MIHFFFNFCLLFFRIRPLDVFNIFVKVDLAAMLHKLHLKRLCPSHFNNLSQLRYHVLTLIQICPNGYYISVPLCYLYVNCRNNYANISFINNSNTTKKTSMLSGCQLKFTNVNGIISLTYTRKSSS